MAETEFRLFYCYRQSTRRMRTRVMVEEPMQDRHPLHLERRMRRADAADWPHVTESRL
jgi:hypothetical protein